MSTNTIEAIYDGHVFRPKQPISLKPDTVVEITIKDEVSENEGHSFVKMAGEAQVIVPADWSKNIEKYLYGDMINANYNSKIHIEKHYQSIKERLNKISGDQFIDQSYDQFIDLALYLQSIAKENGISLEVCCSPFLKPNDRSKLQQGMCINPKYLTKVNPEISLERLKKKPTKKGDGVLYDSCQCYESVDIGANMTCTHGCVFCYANRYGGHLITNIDPKSPWLSTKTLNQESLEKFALM